MSNNAEPVIGSWYEYPEEGEKFEVLEVDEDRGIVEIQYADGEHDEIDLEEWGDLGVDLTDPPEDWAEAAEPGEVAPLKDAEDEPDDLVDDPPWRDED